MNIRAAAWITYCEYVLPADPPLLPGSCTSSLLRIRYGG
jgi:hypothetical protein